MKTGPSVSPLTHLPKDMRDPEAAVKEKREAERLKRLVGEGQVMCSDAGQQLVALVKKRLEKRLAALAKADAQCCAYVAILKDMGVKYAAAKKATKDLAARYLTDADE